MQKKNIKTIALGIVFAPIVLALFILSSDVSVSEIEEVCFDQNCFEVEIADSFEERQRGLMFRESLGEGKGMLFVFEESGIYPFWMKDTFIFLDIIWINSDKEVVFINKDTLPCQEDPCISYDPGTEALYVLEVNSGVSEELGLEIGEIVNFK